MAGQDEKGPRTETRGGRQGLQALLTRLAERTGADPEVVSAARTLLRHIDPPHDGGPFLSVLLRTQGRRPEALRDALLCLVGQSSDDFEVLLLVHDADDTATASVAEIVDDHAPLLADRLRVIPVRGGGRARPLNVGVDESRGRYVVALDDDDLVFGHWVESFADAAERSDGSMLRAVGAVQTMQAMTWRGGSAGFRASSLPSPEYVASFDMVRHLVENQSPFMCLAFPRSVFAALGFRFDETLPVLEDWDMALRTALVLGVVEVPAMTSVYRQWSTKDTSLWVHHDDEWHRARRAVITSLDEYPAVFPPGSVERLRSLIEDENASVQLRALVSSRTWRWVTRVRPIAAPVLRPIRGLARTIRGRLAGRGR